MVLIESSVFTKLVKELLSDDSYREFQIDLILNPEQGDLIKGTHGLRKTRWAAKGHGKSGGVRVIYFYVDARNQIRLLLIYPKNVKVDLTPADKKLLNKMMEAW